MIAAVGVGNLKGAFAQHAVQGGSKFYAMRSTLAQYDVEKRAWLESPDDQVKDVPVGFAARLEAVFSVRTSADLSTALVDVGVADPSSDGMKSLFKVVSSHVLVVVGPAVSNLWRRHDPEHVHDSHGAAAAVEHSQALCTFCVEFALHGTCEHTHVALHAADRLSLSQSRMPERRGAGHLQPSRRGGGSALSPGRPAAQPERAAEGGAAQPAAQPRARLDSVLQRALADCDLGHMKDRHVSGSGWVLSYSLSNSQARALRALVCLADVFFLFFYLMCRVLGSAVD